MATLILGTVGRVIGGPIGGLIGTIAGGLVDRSLFGGNRGGGRLANLDVQSAAYGEPIPIIVGRMRAAGNLVWSSGIAEIANGGSKGGGSGYSYAASFAVALAAGPIVGVGRIWADGTEIRNSAGSFASPVTMRLYTGGEEQSVDPLIAAAEGGSAAPAYRGIAYAVFEALPLAEFGNRIPNLTFEVISSSGSAIDMGDAVRRLAVSDGEALVSVSGRYPAIDGHVAARAGSIADNLAALVAISGAAMSAGDALQLSGDADDFIELPERDSHARRPESDNARDRQIREGGELSIDVVEIGYFDTDRDYQSGLQRARRGGPGALAHQSISSAMPATLAKQLAVTVLARSEASRAQTSARLPWRYVGVRPGMRVRLADDDRIWRVRATRFEAFVVHLDLEHVDVQLPTERIADAGRAVGFASQPAGDTQLRWLDLPPLPGEALALPRLWLAASGAAPGWRRAPLSISLDDGFSYQHAGMAEGGAAQGTAVTALPAGSVAGWDRFSAVEIELLSDSMWLQPASEGAVLAGANMALIGDELVQFAQVEMLGPRRFRLSAFLRGRQGSEAAVTGHRAGECFVLLDRAGLLAIDLPLESIGRTVLGRANGSGDTAAGPVAAVIGGKALLPLSPAHLSVVCQDGDIVANWVRRSRTGFGWPDFADVPIAEASEAYCVEVWVGNVLVRTAATTAPAFVYAADQRLADGEGDCVELRVSQFSALVGPGPAAVATIPLN